MYLAKRPIIGLVVGTALLVALALGNGVAAQEGPETKSFELTPSRGSGVSGTASLRDIEGGVEVTVNVVGLEGGAEYVHHIHEGATCEEDKVDQGGPVEFPLNEVVANDDGTATVTTVVNDITLDELLSGGKERYINFHPAPPEEGQPVPPGITCTTLDPTAGQGGTTAQGGTTMMGGQTGMMGGTTAGIGTADLPESGGPAILLPAAALLLGAGILTYAVVRRR